MATIGYICPKCHILLEKENCDSCGYNSAADTLLRSILHSEYNKALKEAKGSRLECAWNRIKNAILIYPFDAEALRLCFVLSIENGDFQFARACLKRLKTAINPKTYRSMQEELSSAAKKLTSLLENTTDRLSSLSSYTLNELVLLLNMETDDRLRQHIAKELAKRDADIGLRLSIARITRKYQYRIPIIIGLAIVCTVAVWLIISVISYQRDIDQLQSTLEDTSQSLQMVSDSLSHAKEQLHTGARHKSSLLSWFAAFENGDFVRCSEMLSEDSELVRGLQESHLGPLLERLNTKLFESGEYRLILANGVESSEIPHAMYHVANEHYGKDQAARIGVLEQFVTRYPDYPSYTGPFLREIFDYYVEKEPTRAKHYADLLIRWSQNHEESQNLGLISSKVKEISREVRGT